MTRMVKLDKIRLDGMTQFREHIDQNTVKHYADCMRDGAEFPAIQCTFDGSHFWLCDGFHRYFASQAVGFKEMLVEYRPGTLEDAQDLALGANGKHGMPTSRATKQKKVEFALSAERHAGKSDREIAKLCEVSHTFVASVRNPDVKKAQIQNRTAHALQNSGVDSTPDSSGVDSTLKAGDIVPVQPSDADPKVSLTQDYGPDEAELKAMELSQQADQAIFSKMLESDDALKLAHTEITRLNYLLAHKEVRITSLMNEKNAVIKMMKDLEKQLKKATKK